tara:strand:+ start:1103 stop:2473 length:1371 start_codon:yes stop_codon:yes gene_type:complete
MVLDTLVRSAAPEIGKRLLGEGGQKLTKETWQQGLKGGGRNIDNIMKNLNPETPARLPEFLDESDIRMIADVADSHPERSQELLSDFEHMIYDGEPDNFNGGLIEMSHDYRNSISKSQIEAPVPSKEPIAPSQEAPTRYDVEGKEGKKQVRLGAKTWWDEQMNRIKWDPDRAGEIDRSQYARDGIFIDGEEHRWQGVTQYARDRKTLPTLTKVTKSRAQVGRLENEVIQTMGPAFRSKPVVLDALSEVVDPKNVHKHHILLIKVIEPWTRLPNGQPRPKAQIKQLIKALAARNYYIGNIDKNLLWQQSSTHIGDEMGSHGILQGFTDIQGKPKGEKFVEGFGPTEIPGKTYDPNARHGFSEQHIAKIANIKNTKELIATLLMFLDEAGGGEAMRGAAGLAQRNLEQRAVVKKKGKIKDVVSGDILGDRIIENPDVKRDMKNLEAGIKSLKKPKKSK